MTISNIFYVDNERFTFDLKQVRIAFFSNQKKDIYNIYI